MKSAINVIIALVLGFFIGYSTATYFPKPDNKEKPKSLEVKALQPSITAFNFINPLSECSQFESRYFDEMLGFKKEVVDLIDSIMTKMDGYELGFYFRDLTNGTTVGYNERIKFTPASLMKVPILIALLKEAEKDPNILNDMMLYHESRGQKAINKDEFEFKKGGAYSLMELAEIMIAYSDNRAAMMIIEKIGLEKVKKVERDLLLGTEHATYNDKRSIGVKTYATVFRTLYNASYLSKEMSEKALIILSHSRYGYGIRKSIPSEIIIAHKFGIRESITYNGESGGGIEELHHFGIVYRPEKPYLIGIMMKGDDEKFMKRMISHIAMHVDVEIQQRIEQIQREGIIKDAR